VLPELDEPEELPLLERPVPLELPVLGLPLLDLPAGCEPPWRVVDCVPFMPGLC
jgi:hypothetical protein